MRPEGEKTPPPDEVAHLTKAVESLRLGGFGDLLGQAEEKLEAAKAAKLLGRPVSQQCRRLEQLLAKKQKSLDKTIRDIEVYKEQITKTQEDIKEAEAFASKLEVEVEGLAKEISWVPRNDKPAASSYVQGTDLVPAQFKEGEVWKKTQANLDEAFKTMLEIVEGAKQESPEDIAAPATPPPSQSAARPKAEQDFEETSDDVDMDEVCDEDDKTKMGDLFADAALGISDDVRKELKRKTIELMDGMLKSRKHLLKSRKARSSVG